MCNQTKSAREPDGLAWDGVVGGLLIRPGVAVFGLGALDVCEDAVGCGESGSGRWLAMGSMCGSGREVCGIGEAAADGGDDPGEALGRVVAHGLARGVFPHRVRGALGNG